MPEWNPIAFDFFWAGLKHRHPNEALLRKARRGTHSDNPEDRPARMPKPSPTHYCTMNCSARNTPLRKRGSFAVCFEPDMVWHAEKSGKRARPETFSDAAIHVCLTLKVFVDFLLRQAVGQIERLIRTTGLDWPVRFVGRPFDWEAR